MEEYLNNCTYVENTELARHPEKYEGEDIALEGKFSILAGEIIIGWWEDTGIISVDYEGDAVYMDGSVAGKVVTDDYGIVAGKYSNEDIMGNKHIDAEIIILENDEE